VANITNRCLQACHVIDVSIAAAFSPPACANLHCGAVRSRLFLKVLKSSRTPGFELFTHDTWMFRSGNHDVDVIRSTVHGMKCPSPLPAMLGDCFLNDGTLLGTEPTSCLGHPRRGFHHFDRIRRLPTVRSQYPAACVAGEPSAVSRPSQEVGQGVCMGDRPCVGHVEGPDELFLHATVTPTQCEEPSLARRVGVRGR